MCENNKTFIKILFNFYDANKCMKDEYSKVIANNQTSYYLLFLSAIFCCSPVCFDVIDEAHMTKCGHSFW